MSTWPFELRTASPPEASPAPAAVVAEDEDDGDRDRLAFFVVALVVVPLVAAATTAALAGGLAGAGVVFATGLVAGTVSSSFAVWRDERWDVVAGVALTATVCGAFLAFGLGSTLAFWLFMFDPCSGPCL